uniref:Fe2OG dioxygenase domain-containing protein n=1 Tax=Leersia perrieri TaxID=77586 RepID=A0A0D9W1K7_9ORYZ
MESAAERPENLGGSLPVPNVQDLAGRPDDLTPTILRRYLRADPTSTTNIDQVNDGIIPVVDLGRLVAGDEEEASKLRQACEEWGFFQVVNHGISDDTVEEMKRDVTAFFNLPLAAKSAFAQRPGWIEGYGQAFVTSDDQTLDWSDIFFLATQPPSYRDLRFWPPEDGQLITFRRSVERYSAATQRVAGDLLAAMAFNLGLRDAGDMTCLAAAQSMRMNYYPPCPSPAARDRVLGVSPHSDAVGLTLLLQVSPTVAGLQIRRPDGGGGGGWMGVDPIAGALVANAGDVIEVLTNGRYKSIEHRAVVDATRERVSVAAFHSATFGSTYAPLHEMVGDGGVPKYRSITVEDYVRLVVSSKLDGKNIMDAMKVN